MSADNYNQIDAPLSTTDWAKEYGLSKSIMALWDGSSTEGQHAGCIVKFNDSTNAATLADGVAHNVNSRRRLNPENWVFRPHYVLAENGADGTWDVRLVAEHENNSDSRDNHGTMLVNQKNKKAWGWLNDIAWLRALDTPAGDDELKFNEAGFLPALLGGKGGDKRSVVAIPTCRNGGFVTDGKYDGQWSQAGKFIIGPAVVDPPAPRPGTTTGGGAGGAGSNTVTSRIGNVGGGYSNTGIPNLNSGMNGVGATYQGGGYGGLANPNLTYGQGSGVTLQGGGYSGLANAGQVSGYSGPLVQGPQNNGPINQGGGYGGTSNPGGVAGYSETIGGNRGSTSPGDASGQSSPYGGGSDGGATASASPESGGGYGGGYSGGGDGGDAGPAGGDDGGSGGMARATDGGTGPGSGSGYSPPGTSTGAGNAFDGSATGNNTTVNDGPGQTQVDADKKRKGPGQTQTDPKEKLAVEWGMRADCGIDFGNNVIGRLVHEPMSATEGDGEPRLVKLFCDTNASPDDGLDTEIDDSSNHQKLPKKVRKKAIHGWVRVPKSVSTTSHYDYSYHGTPPNKENKSGSSGGSSGTPTGGAGVPGTTGVGPPGGGSGAPPPTPGPVPPNEGGSSSPTGGTTGGSGSGSGGTGSSGGTGDLTTTTETRLDGNGNTWTRDITRDGSGSIVGLPTSWTQS